jgi:hypothetical protein
MYKIVKTLFYSFIPVMVGAIAISCGNNQSQETPPPVPPQPKVDTTKKAPAPPKPVSKQALDTVTPNRKYNDIARYIAGMKQLPGSTLPATLEKDTVWIRFAKTFDSEWAHDKATRLDPMASWGNTELAEQHKANLDVFYPFSGPDILHANVLFPNAKRYHLYGLERAGALPDLNKMKPKVVESYLEEVYTSLSDILTKSYFITKNMLNDLQQNNVNGTLPLASIFLVRSGYQIVNVKYFHINEDGTEVQLKKDSVPVHSNDFVKVYFKYDKDSTVQVMSYLKCDLSDGGLQKNKGVTAWLDAMPVSYTYIKSASYLLHNPFFSAMRAVILKKSQTILQDDTGMPYKYLPGKDWNLAFYGAYIMPVSSFPRGFYQTDLQKAYHNADSLKQLKKLPFSLGYHWGSSVQNLMKAERKG